jgi:transcriptional regulator with GAF, ATPase, and Fis domain
MSNSSSFTSKELDILLHHELQKSTNHRESIEAELNDLVDILNSYQKYKAKVVTSNESRTFAEYRALKLSAQDDTSRNPQDIAKPMKVVSTPAVVTPNVLSTSSLLSNLKGLKIEPRHS